MQTPRIRSAVSWRTLFVWPLAILSAVCGLSPAKWATALGASPAPWSKRRWRCTSSADRVLRAPCRRSAAHFALYSRRSSLQQLQSQRHGRCRRSCVDNDELRGEGLFITRFPESLSGRRRGHPCSRRLPLRECGWRLLASEEAISTSVTAIAGLPACTPRTRTRSGASNPLAEPLRGSRTPHPKRWGWQDKRGCGPCLHMGRT
jgi:hypothetical protein